jgi:hypothetical protein
MIPDFSEFNAWTEELIRQTLINRTTENAISSAIILRREIEKALIEFTAGGNYPAWLLENITSIINEFIKLFQSADSLSSNTIAQKIYSFRRSIIYGENLKEYSVAYTLPFLENYAKTINIMGYVRTIATTDKKVDEAIKKLSNQSNAQIKSIESKYKSIENSVNKTNADIASSFNKIKVDADATLALLNKEAGKIAVKNYAEIFDGQALEHSRFFKDKSGNYKFTGIGKAQLWLMFAIVAFGLLVAYFTQLDKFFSLKDQYIFTPEVVVHIIGRFLLISLFIFIVSFSFKQFRINMHLYTLNKHRANTLKSFEYLTRAPDKLEAGSYNAILMEVAKAIYEAGHTGYININENSSDLPSIVDMSKVITQPKT